MNKKRSHARPRRTQIRLHPVTEKHIAKMVVRVLRKSGGRTRKEPSPLPGTVPSLPGSPVSAETMTVPSEQPVAAPNSFAVSDGGREAAGPVDTKQMNVLVRSLLLEDSHWHTEQSILDGLRLVTKVAAPVKHLYNLPAGLTGIPFDLLLVLGNPDANFFDEWQDPPLPGSPVKAVWLADAAAPADQLSSIADAFDLVFTQNINHIPLYRYMGCRHVFYLPFAADHSVYLPKTVNSAYQSDILFIGNADPRIREMFAELEPLLSDKKVFAMGLGWQPEDGVTCVRPLADLQDYYNGASVIIYAQPEPGQVLAIAACGGFLLAENEPNLYDYMRPDEDVVIFRSAGDLQEKLQYYMERPELMRYVSTNALYGSKYRNSCLQMVLKLLHLAARR
ncbi:DUF3880 domain-containing protein [Paenibacillus sp. XY044]|uniref:glycosyltransferase family protein n=1 Tax=Paenibacillus sp. XY044 TaxID=2026089 RepID=UPI000B9946EE|nr:DUF3880 domain-containing protein [Paenibacillus sp. XY044]OZB91854.1 hypothetical protein CJP46_27975 [Paenibacillus sp. XY044]